MNVSPWLLIALLAAVLLYGYMRRKATNGGEDAPPAPENTVPASDEVRFGSAGLRLSPPPDFTVASTFDGLEQVSSGASVMVTRVPGPFAQVSAGFTEAGLDSRGMYLISRDERTQDGLPALLLHVSQTAQGTPFMKWLLGFGDATETFLVTGTWPEAQDSELSERMLRAVLSARRDTLATVAEVTADAPFTISAGADLFPAQSIGKTLLFTRDGKTPTASANDPLFVAVASLGAADTSDRNGFARTRVQQTEQVRGVTIIAQAPLHVDDLDGVEIVARGSDAKTGTALTLYQAILFDGDQYFLMQGQVGMDEQRTFLPVFKTMTRTFRRTQTG